MQFKRLRFEVTQTGAVSSADLGGSSNYLHATCKD